MTTSPSFARLASLLGRRWAAILMLVGAMLASSLAAFAQGTITVNDTNQIATDCTLSSAILLTSGVEVINGVLNGCLNSVSGNIGTGATTIQLQANQTYTMTTADNYWYGPNALPPIATTIIIEGNGATLQITDSTIVRLRFFFVGADPTATATLGYIAPYSFPAQKTPGAGNLTLHNLTLTGGRQQGGNSFEGGGGAGMGGAIYNQGQLTLNQVTINGNSATGGNTGYLTCGCDVISGGGGMGEDGGTGDGTNGGGGFGGAVTPTSQGGSGGEQNSAGGGGGIQNDGLYNTYDGWPGEPGCGGAGGGSADGLGSGVGISSPYCDSQESYGAGASSGSGSNTIPGGHGGGFGAGGGSAEGYGGGGVGGGGGSGGGNGGFGGGGGGFNGGGGGGAGGFGGGGGSAGLGSGPNGFGANGGGAGFGGAIFNHNGTVQVTNSTFNGNTATGGMTGGGLYPLSPGGSGYGGAIFNLNGTVTLTFSTLAGNIADDGGAVYNLGYQLGDYQAYLYVDNSILSDSVNASATAVADIANNQPPAVASGAANVGLAGVFYFNFNVVMALHNTFGGVDIFDIAPFTSDPGLLPLTLNAPGSTATMAITTASVAYDVIFSGCTDINNNPITVDQRGVTRPQVAGRCDIGAYELIPSVNVTVGTSPSGLLVSLDGGTPQSAPVNVNWNIGSHHTIATTSPQFPSAGTQETFASWSDSGALSHSVTASAGTTGYTASFSTTYLLTTAANPPSGGTVTPASGTYYAPTTVVPLTATANANYAFSNWTGYVANTNSASTAVLMSAPQSVTANFVAVGPQVTASPSSISLGNVDLCRTKTALVTLHDNAASLVQIGPVSIIDVTGNPSDFSFLTYSTTGILGPNKGHSYTILVKFSPTEEIPESATLNIVTNAPGSPVQVPITGTGIKGPKGCDLNP